MDNKTRSLLAAAFPVSAAYLPAPEPEPVVQRIPTQMEYELAERNALMRQLREIEQAPIEDRREARMEWTEALVNADGGKQLVAERVGWLLSGSYGKGAYDAAWQIVGNKRSNRVAGLGQLVAALEWRCPANFAAEAWRKLDTARQTAVNACIQEEIDYAMKERGTR